MCRTTTSYLKTVEEVIRTIEAAARLFYHLNNRIFPLENLGIHLINTEKNTMIIIYNHNNYVNFPWLFYLLLFLLLLILIQSYLYFYFLFWFPNNHFLLPLFSLKIIWLF